ncbi:MAG: family 16 glycosylhydrolase [Verrucomicrobiae bacterium]|nr:family 16 glycosylhydrolase [Verrucomicrobiae bacterium]
MRNTGLPLRKASFSLLAAAILFGCLVNARGSWQMTWSDEFDGNTLNSNNWTFDIGNGSGGWGNNELEYYTSRPQNVYVTNGLLHIVANKESYGGQSYTSAKLKTTGLFSKKYGRFEFKAKLPQGQGYWPALWMMPQDEVYGGWAASGEIDVMENKGNNPTNVLGTIHYGGMYPNNTHSSGPSFNFPAGDSVTNFHVYALEWTNNAIRWYVDNQLYETQTSWWSSSNPTNTSIRNPYPAPFDQAFYLIMNLAVGGNFGGNPDGTTVFPQEMQVDYVRVFDWAAPATNVQVYVPATSHRVDVGLDANWRFIRQDVAGAQAGGFDDSAWTSLNLPHTWNNLDGQDGGNNYYRGIGWYRSHFTPDASYTNREFFLKFDGAFSVADVWINGNYLGEHQGGFAAFVFDATPFINVGGDNVIAVKVNNAYNANIPPLSADFTFFGGLYRDVHLLVTDPVQVSPLDYGSLGIYLRATNVSASSANLQITTVVSNSTAAMQTITVRAVVTDAATNIVATLTNVVTLAAATGSNVVVGAVITNPHLWKGLADPYLYQTFVEIYNGTNLIDVVSQPLGFRWFSVDPTNGFALNGQHYDLHGVDMHQDWLNCGWALTNAQRETNFIFLKEIGATVVRLSHYEHHDHTYELADQNGIILWSEVPVINSITESPAFYTNAVQQLTELIRQRYNHPSVICWGLYNEITSTGQNPTNLISQLAQVAAQEDPTRLSTAAANSSDNAPTAAYSQVIAFNKYYGWYSGVMTDFGPWADNFHATYPARAVGVSEYGAGASIYQHSENPVTEPANAGPYHPEEYQDIFHETYWQQMKARPFLWGTFIWNLFDFASDGRNEGDTPGRNDKGLVTYDRQTRKDAFYFYKANWTTNPMVYITGHTFTNRSVNAVTAKVYANCDSVELFVNGASQGVATGTNCIFTWPVTLFGGSNVVQAIGSKGGSNVTDTLLWIAPVIAPGISITNPSTSTVFINNTNAILMLAATVTDYEPASAPPVTTAWSMAGGPGTVVFGDTNALSTTSRFSTNGVYNLVIQAVKGALNSSAALTVVVGNVPYGPTLKVRFVFDDPGPGTNTPSDTSGGGASINLKMFNSSGAAADYHGAANSGVAGLTTGSRALNFSANASQGGSGPVAAVTNAGLGFGSVSNFLVTLWFKQSVLLPGNIGPRMFVLGNSTNTDCGTANSIGMKFQDASDLSFFVNGNQATAAFGSSLPLNSWIFVAMAYDGTNVSLYEGSDLAPATLVSRTAVANQIVPFSSAASVDIGNRLNRDRDFAGWIDDFRFYAGMADASYVEGVRQSAAGPAGLTAAAGNNQVALTWNATAGAVSYNLKRSTVSGGPYTVVSPPGTVTGTNWIDATAINGQSYYYVVSAATPFIPIGETANSPTEAAVTLPTPPAAPVAGYNSPMYAGMTLYLTASTVAGAAYNWTGPNGFTAASQNPVLVKADTNASGIYSVTATAGSLTSVPGTIAVTVNPSVTFTAQISSGSFILNWSYGTLQSATNVTGPWCNVSGAAPPFTNPPAGPQQFYRIQLQ